MPQQTEVKGALRKLADGAGLDTFIIPDDVGGRFSVLTPVGLLPIAAAGYNIRELIRGARAMMESTRSSGADNIADNTALAYACYRNTAYRQGKKIEILASYQSTLHFIAEWWKQLFGESEGKENRGVFPASADLTTDLHSLGQGIQEGETYNF